MHIHAFEIQQNSYSNICLETMITQLVYFRFKSTCMSWNIKIESTNMYIARARGEPIPAVASSRMNIWTGYRVQVDSLDPRLLLSLCAGIQSAGMWAPETLSFESWSHQRKPPTCLLLIRNNFLVPEHQHPNNKYACIYMYVFVYECAIALKLNHQICISAEQGRSSNRICSAIRAVYFLVCLFGGFL